MLFRTRTEDPVVVTDDDGVTYSVDPKHTYDSENPADAPVIRAARDRFLFPVDGTPERATAAPGEKRTTTRASKKS